LVHVCGRDPVWVILLGGNCIDAVDDPADRRPAAWSAGLAIGLSAIYFWSTARVLQFLRDRPSVNSSAQSSILFALVVPGMLYLAALAQWLVYRRRLGSLLPVAAAALFGSFFCFLLVA